MTACVLGKVALRLVSLPEFRFSSDCHHYTNAPYTFVTISSIRGRSPYQGTLYHAINVTEAKCVCDIRSVLVVSSGAISTFYRSDKIALDFRAKWP